MAEKKERPVIKKIIPNGKEIRHGSQIPDALNEGLDFTNTLRKNIQPPSYLGASPYADDDGKKR